MIWYDPKIKNIALDDNYKSEWNEKYYKLSSEKEKGRYNIDNFIDDKTINKFVIVDTDLFLPIDVVKKINEIYKQNEDLAFFKNWKYTKMLEYENRFNKEGNI